MSYFCCNKCGGTFDPQFTYCPVCEDVPLIEQLQAKVVELEAENAKLHEQVDLQVPKMVFTQLKEQLAAAREECEFQRNAHKQAEELMLEQSNQLAAEQSAHAAAVLQAKQLREALQTFIAIAAIKESEEKDVQQNI